MVRLFVKYDTNKNKVLEVQPYDQICILLKKLNISDKKTKFFYKGEIYYLASILTFEEIGLVEDNSRIIINNVPPSGGGGITFTDLSKNKTVKLGSSSFAPSYRTCKIGLNIFGFCKRYNCETKGEEVVVHVNKDRIDLVKENFHCPICGEIIEPKTIGLYLCRFRIYGEKKSVNGILTDFDGGIEDADDKENLRFFDPEENGTAFFFKLIIEIKEYH